MAETELTVTAQGAAKSWTNAHPDGHFYKNNGHTILFVENTTGSTHTVSHTEQRACDFGHSLTNRTDDAATGETTEVWAAKNIHRFNDNVGKAHITFTTTAPNSSALRVAAVDYSKA